MKQLPTSMGSWSPEAVLDALPRSGVSAGLWRIDSPDTIEADEPPLAEHHLISFHPTACPVHHAAVDGERTFEGRVTAGTFSILRAGERVQIGFSGPATILHMVVPVGLLKECAEAAGHQGSVCLERPVSVRDAGIDRLGREIMAEMREPSGLGRLHADLLSQQLGLRLLRGYSSFDQARLENHRGGLAPWQVRRVKEYLAENLRRNVTLVEVAALTHLSLHHFCRAFRTSAGVPPHQYLMRIRVERARALLERTNLPVTQIALEVGYETSQALARVFQRELGMPPSEYRRRTQP
jgi:AraC family transcriptional regulator